MIRIEITREAYAALALSRSSLLEAHRSPLGGFYVWLSHSTLAKLKAIRAPSESYSDAIIRLAAMEAH